MSRSGDLALFAVGFGARVGIDIERVIPASSWHDVLASLAPEERRHLLRLPPELRDEGFVCCTTRKEAYIKAAGGGLSLGLDRFAVSADPRETPRLIKVTDPPEEPSRWHFVNIHPATGYRGCLAVETPVRESRYPVGSEENPAVVDRDAGNWLNVCMARTIGLKTIVPK